MTSYILAQHTNGREIHPSYRESDARCPFCQIANKEGKNKHAYVVYEDDHSIAFLDLMPIRKGHTLLIPKTHCTRLADLAPDVASVVGANMPRIISAINKAIDNPDLNVVLNQGFAQAVPHAHFHLIPAPHPTDLSNRTTKKSGKNRSPADWTAQELMENPPDHKEMLKGETEARMGWLSPSDGEAISERIRSFL